MINKAFIKQQFLKEWDYYLNRGYVDFNSSPLFYKIHLDLSKEEFEIYIRNFYKLKINQKAM